jgi:hypothetical protein
VAFVSILAFGFVALFAAQIRRTYDGAIMAQVAVSLAKHATPLVHPIDDLGLNTPYSGYGIGTSIVMAVLFKAGEAIRVNPFGTLNLTAPLLYAATVTATFVLLRRLGFAFPVVAAVTALLALATPLLAYGLSDFSEPGTALFVALGLLALEAVRRRPVLAPLSAGAAIGGAGLMRTDSWVLVALPALGALFALSERRTRSLVLAALGVAPFAAVWIAYNLARFDSPVSSGYDNQPFSHPFIAGLYGLTLSPGRGVFIYVPLLLVGIAAVPAARGRVRMFGVLAIALLAVRIVFYARWWSWYGGDSWGPRFMVPALPAFAVPLADALSRWFKNPLVHAASVGSLAMSGVGFLVAIGTIPLPYGQAPFDFRKLDSTPPQVMGKRLVQEWTSNEYVDATDRIMFDWSRFPTRG